MTWTWESFMGGETRDPLIEGWYDAGTSTSGLWLQNTAACENCSLVTSPVKNGTGAIKVGNAALNEGHVTYFTTTAPTGKLKILEGHFCLPSAPSGEFSLFYDTTTGAAELRVGTDGRLRCALGPAASQWSVSALPMDATTFAHVCWVIDPITLGSAHVWNTVYINGIPEIMWDSGVEASYGASWLMTLGSHWTYLPELYVDDLCAAVSSDSNDAPHITAPPIGKMSAQHPTAAGDNDAGPPVGWTPYPNTGERYDQDWDDATGNDGDTTYNKATTTSQKRDSHMQSADTLGWGAGAAPLHNPIYSLVHRMVSGIGSKWSAFTLCDLVTAITLTAPGYSYGGYGRSFTRSSGSWGRDDLGTMSVGGQTSATGMDREWRITTLLMQWLFTDSSLVKAPAPMIPQGGMF